MLQNRALLESLGRTYDHDLRTKYYTRLAKEIKYTTVKELSMRYYESDFDLLRWYPKLEKLTMPSEIVSVTKGVAKRLVTKGEVPPFEFDEIHHRLGGDGVIVKFRRSPKDSLHSLRIRSLEDFIKVCTTSERLKEDVENAPGDTLEIALRKWVDGMRLEVRGFICCGELNAVTIQPN
jgi:hypothetical protein